MSRMTYFEANYLVKLKSNLELRNLKDDDSGSRWVRRAWRVEVALAAPEARGAGAVAVDEDATASATLAAS